MMTAPTDAELLAAYAHKGEEQAFREFVQRHATWVLGVATRSAGQVALAEEIAQTVFCLAAQKAGALAEGRVVVAAWLHRTALLTTANAVRGERRHREKLERAAAELTPLLTMTEDESTLYHDLLPHLDAALDALPEGDRALLLQRYFEQRGVAHIARSVGISEDACQKRLSRAVGRLGVALKRHRVAVSSVMLTSILSAPMGKAAPAEFVRSLADQALLAQTGKATVAAYAVAAPLAGASLTVALTGAALVAFAVPVGWQLRENAVTPPVQTLVSEQPVSKSPTKSVPTTNVDPILAQFSAALAALRDDNPEGLMELVLFVANLPLEKLPGAWEILRQHADHSRTIVRALFCRWTEMDLQGAVAASSLTDNNSLRCSVWHGIASLWAVRDPKAYFAEVAKFPIDPKLPLPWQEIANWHGLTKLANARPEVALEFVKSLPDPKRQLSVTKMALSLWGQRDPDAAIRHLKATYKEQELDEMMHLMAEEVAYHQPAVTFQISTQQANPHYREKETCFALQQWGADDPKAAAAALAAVPPEIQTSSLAQNVTRTLMQAAADETLAIAKASPPGEFREGMLDTIAMHFYNDKEQRSLQRVLETALLMGPGQHRDFNLEHAAKDWLLEDTPRASAWLEAHPEYPAELRNRLPK